MGDETQPAMCYPQEEQYERWKEWADEMEMSVSEFMQAMVEAGYKKFDTSVEPDSTNEELRQQRNDLKTQLRSARQRIEVLEDELHSTEREDIVRFLRENPAASHADVVRYITDSAPRRVQDHLDMMEGERVRAESGEYYALNE